MKDETFHYIPEEETFAQRLNARLEDCKEAIIASAFFTFGAFQQFKPSLVLTLESGAKIKFLLGRFDFVTEPKAVKGLLALASKYPDQLNVYFDGDFGFHYKLARFKNSKASVVFIGSSNLTPKGLASAGEVNLEIVSNANVFKQTGKILNDRIKVALDAEKYLDEYKIKYNRAKRYRNQRHRWERSGQNKLTGIRRIKHSGTELDEDNYVFCRAEGYVDDDDLEKRVDNKRKENISKGINLPKQWILLGGKSESHNYQENQIVFILDDTTYCMGFARCNKVIYAINGKGKEQSVLFYRYLRGWQAKFNKVNYSKAKKELGLKGNPNQIGKIMSTRLKRYLKDHRK